MPRERDVDVDVIELQQVGERVAASHGDVALDELRSAIRTQPLVAEGKEIDVRDVAQRLHQRCAATALQRQLAKRIEGPFYCLVPEQRAGRTLEHASRRDI